MTLQYSIALNHDGARVFSAVVPALEAGLVGDYHGGKPYQPSRDATRQALPARYRKAFDRALSWWATKHASRHIPLKCELRDSTGKPMGTLYATPMWDAIAGASL